MAKMPMAKMKGPPCKKPGSPISMERFAFLQLFALRKVEKPSLTFTEFQLDLQKAMMGVDNQARKQGHKVKIFDPETSAPGRE